QTALAEIDNLEHRSCEQTGGLSREIGGPSLVAGSPIPSILAVGKLIGAPGSLADPAPFCLLTVLRQDVTHHAAEQRVHGGLTCLAKQTAHLALQRVLTDSKAVQQFAALAAIEAGDHQLLFALGQRVICAEARQVRSELGTLDRHELPRATEEV